MTIKQLIYNYLDLEIKHLRLFLQKYIFKKFGL